jgi:pyruvate ferredoxin oxidoreductase alpha subunit
MSVSSRALSAPLNIHGEHGDVMAVRDLGWIQIFAEQAQDAYDDTIIALKLAEEINAPVMPIMDGFHTSHTTERVEILEDSVVKEFVGERKAEQSLLDFENPTTFGTLALQNTFFEFKLEQEKVMQKAKTAYKKICGEFFKISGRKYHMFEEYQMKDATSVIVIMGATAGTAKEVVDKLRGEGKKVGLLVIKLFRPFPYKEVGQALAHLKKIAVLDRAISFGAFPPLYQDIVSSVYHSSSRKPDLVSYIYGLGGRDTMQKDLEKVFQDLEDGEISNKVKYLK